MQRLHQKKQFGLSLSRRLYHAKEAQKEYAELLVAAREGVPLNKSVFYETEEIISNAVRNGQHIYHILKSNELQISKSTVYRHIKKGYYSISDIDLPRMVKFKPQRKKHKEYVPNRAKTGRTYSDFLAYIEENEITSYAEMDTVIGRIGGKVILTLHFNAFGFMTGLLLENKTAAETAAKIKSLKKRLREAGFCFGDIFPLLLTDNGGEFNCVSEIESSCDGGAETKLFFCKPNASYVKPHIEKNHTLLRDIVPNGSSFDGFTQETVKLIFSHINGVKRSRFYVKSAFA